MVEVEPRTIPTASVNMFKKSANSELPLPLRLKGKGRDRVRSKSESYHLQGRVGGPLNHGDGVQKNDRKPKNMKGNGKPKKSGGGGKGTWGKAGQIYDEEESDDPDDPNYDPESVRTDAVILRAIPSDLTSAEFDKLDADLS